jgi:hypothetical protein
MGIEVFDCEQNSDAWRSLRCGLATASEFHCILAKGEGKTRRAYLLRLAGEILTGVPAETYENGDMIRGREMEPEARGLYSFVSDVELLRVGFIRNGRVGCSPDSLISSDGMVEIKTKKAALLIECILKNEFPPEHKAQVQGALWVAGRVWSDLAIYWPGLPLFVQRAYRDEGYIAALATEVDRFNAELDKVVAQVRAYRGDAKVAA